MRDFKFKAIYLSTKTVFDTKMLMEHEHLEDFIDGVKESAGDIGTKWSPLLQYTGLKDKNGIEIYEGDIVKVSDSKEKFRNIIEQIKFSRGSFDLDDTELWRLEDDYNSGKIFYEVIGNIYEHPHLLEANNHEPHQ